MAVFMQIYPSKYLPYEHDIFFYSWSKTIVSTDSYLYAVTGPTIFMYPIEFSYELSFSFCILYSVCLCELNYPCFFFSYLFFLEELSRRPYKERAFDRTSPIRSHFQILLIRTNVSYSLEIKILVSAGDVVTIT